MKRSDLPSEFLARMGDTTQLPALFDLLPETYFFVKDDQGRFIFMNQALLQALGMKTSADITGKTDFDLFDADLAERYRDEDRLVMKSNSMLKDQVWLVPNRDGTLHWYLSSKAPIHDRDGAVIGIAGVMRDFAKAGSALGPYRKLSPVLRHIQDNYPDTIEVGDLAEIAEVSVSTLERSFKKLFQLTPSQYLMRVRLHAARRALAETDQDINRIALDCGFCDQSHFTKKFRAAFGLTPSQFRKAADRRDGREARGI